MNKREEVIVVGGGLAGLCYAIHLLQNGQEVMLIEKQAYPRHKVCGEYLSNEVLPYLKQLGIEPFTLGATKIGRLEFSAEGGSSVSCELPLGGFGLSRYVLDKALYDRAEALGCKMLQDKVVGIHFREQGPGEPFFEIETQHNGRLQSRLVTGAYGKRSILDHQQNRDFIQRYAPWLALKAHYKGSFPEDLVGLYHFEGGYCGISKVEKGKLNICYLASYEGFREHKNPEAYVQQVLQKNNKLKAILDGCTMIFEQPISISQISFEKKDPVSSHVLMIGDTAGLIHPFCGNGMAMAIHSAQLCALQSLRFLGRECSRANLESSYAKEWNKNFKRRMLMGRILAGAMRKRWLLKQLLPLMQRYPQLLSSMIRQTHGKPIVL